MIAKCTHCGVIVDAPPHGEYTAMSTDGDVYRYSLVSCPLCLDALLVIDEPLMDGEWTEAATLYPQRKRLPIEVPSNIRNAFIEAESCHMGGHYTAAAGMCRKAVQAVCDNKGATGKNLEKQIDSLETTGVIDSTLTTWSHALRKAGNTALHDTNVTVKEVDSADLLAFTEALINVVFVVGQRFEDFKRRQGLP